MERLGAEAGAAVPAPAAPRPSVRTVVDDYGVLHELRRCSVCRRWLPNTLEHFNWRKGKRTLQSPCLPCKREWNRNARARMPHLRQPVPEPRTAEERRKARQREASRRWKERNRERQREYQRQRRKDPEYVQRELERKRMDWRLRRMLAGLPVRDVQPEEYEGGDDLRLPALPLAQAIRRIARLEEQRNPDAVAYKGGLRDASKDTAGGRFNAVCARAELAPRRVTEWESGEGCNVTMALADRVLTRLGLLVEDVWSLEDLGELLEAA